MLQLCGPKKPASTPIILVVTVAGRGPHPNDKYTEPIVLYYVGRHAKINNMCNTNNFTAMYIISYTYALHKPISNGFHVDVH